MQIGGLVPFTLSDFPGEIAATCFVQGCNFSCPFCHNRPLIPRSSPEAAEAGTEKILSFLSRRKGKVTALVVSGGEPTLQQDLDDFLEQVKALGLKVKLDTNGSRPKVLKRLLEKDLLDFVAMDVKAPWEKYHVLAGRPVDTGVLEQSVKLILDCGIRCLFRTTFVPGLLDHEDIEKIRGILPSGAPYRVQPYVKPALAA